MPIFTQKNGPIIGVVVVSLFLIGVVLFSDNTEQDALPQNQQVQGASTDTTLEVREAIGDPAPLDTNLQSPQGQTSQEAAGQLQVPRGVDELQPNSRTLQR